MENSNPVNETPSEENKVQDVVEQIVEKTLEEKFLDLFNQMLEKKFLELIENSTHLEDMVENMVDDAMRNQEILDESDVESIIENKLDNCSVEFNY